jgi:hypothetical protein
MSFTVTINSVDRTASVQAYTFRKRDILNNQVDSCTFKVWKYGALTFVPEVGQEVVVVRNSVTIFGGVILRVDETVEASKKLVYSVECADYSQYLKRRLVTERYTNTTVAAIIEDLVDSYTEVSDGITDGNVVGTQAVKSISFNRLTVAECLEKLSDALSYVWYVDYDKSIHFFPKNTENAPFSLSDTSNNYIYDSLQITADISQLRNSVLVQGGEDVSANTRTELFSGDGARAQFPLANKYDSAPTVEVGGVAQTVGVEFLNDDASFDVMWNFNEKYLRFTAGNIPGSGTNNIEVTGTYLFPIVVKVPSPASQEVFGPYEFAITDRTIRSQSEAIERALAELQVYKNTLFEGQFRTYNDGLRSGQVLTIASNQRGKAIEVLIQSVEAKMRDRVGDLFEYTVRFATLRSLGIIEYLQKQLRDKNLIIDDQDTLLNLFQLTDTATTSDTIDTPTFTSPPYFVGTTAVMGYFTMG